MRYSSEHKASTRRRIVEGAAATLRARGLAGVGVAELMRQAGLTHGGFYAHFPSKDALIAEAIDAASEQSVRNLRKAVKRAPAKSALSAIVDAYLSAAHRDRPDRGCALAALGAEGARESPAARPALALQMEGLLGLLAEHVPDRPGVSRRHHAIAVLSGLVGGLVLSRLADDRQASDEILAAVRGHLTRPADRPLSRTARMRRLRDANRPLARSANRHQPGRAGADLAQAAP
jgi:TetR/AcrR family transcriptional repressor of nem operon